MGQSKSSSTSPYVLVKTDKYSFEIPRGWTVGEETPWGARDMVPASGNGKLGAMTAGPTKASWDELYRTSLYFIQREEKGKVTPFRTGKTKQGYECMSFEVTQASGFVNRRFTGVYVNEVQGNPFQVDLNFRGYTASPLLGTPQGISVYLDGVRMNQPFGDVVSWDLIPRNAIAEMTLMPGSNPLFGLNTLGGALSVRTKTGRTAPGTSGPPDPEGR